MTLENRRQCENTRVKLADLQTIYDKKLRESGHDHIRDLTLQSLKKRINQLREEIARFEARMRTGPSD